MSSDELVPLEHDEEPIGFDTALRGYDRGQVDDYLERVEAALSEADQRHAEDARRLLGVSQELELTRRRLADAERRAAAQPESATQVGGRLATMLRLAEEEAGAIRAGAQAQAAEMLEQAHRAAQKANNERTAELDRRDRDSAGAAQAAETLRLQAQREADNMRSRAEREAAGAVEAGRKQGEAEVLGARQQAQATVEQARAEAAVMTREARRQVEELSGQRDAIARQLQQLRDTLSSMVGQPVAPQQPEPQPVPGQPVQPEPTQEQLQQQYNQQQYDQQQYDQQQYDQPQQAAGQRPPTSGGSVAIG